MKAIMENTRDDPHFCSVEVGVGCHGGAPGGRVRLAIVKKGETIAEAWVDRMEFVHAAAFVIHKVRDMEDREREREHEREHER